MKKKRLRIVTAEEFAKTTEVGSGVLDDLMDAAERAYFRLWIEYRRDLDEDVPKDECWSEAENLRHRIHDMRTELGLPEENE